MSRESIENIANKRRPNNWITNTDIFEKEKNPREQKYVDFINV
jgi:hypothetical protein